MLVNFDIKKLDILLFDFYKLTGLTISIWDTDFNQLTFQPKKIARFCEIIKSTPKGVKRCYQSDKYICSLCKEKGEPVSHRCHAGLIDTAIPLRFENVLLGYIMFGQVVDKNDSTLSFEEVKTLCSDLPVNIDELEKAYEGLQYFSKETIDSAGNIVKVIARYIYLSDLIKFKNNDLATEIERYIINNLSDDINVSDICKLFCISKNKLYAISEQWYQTTIGNYITQKRIEKAKELLTNTDKLIYQICVEVGIPDYNYFTKVFKKATHTTPHKYRKENTPTLHKVKSYK